MVSRWVGGGGNTVHRTSPPHLLVTCPLLESVSKKNLSSLGPNLAEKWPVEVFEHPIVRTYLPPGGQNIRFSGLSITDPRSAQNSGRFDVPQNPKFFLESWSFVNNRPITPVCD